MTDTMTDVQAASRRPRKDGAMKEGLTKIVEALGQETFLKPLLILLLLLLLWLLLLLLHEDCGGLRTGDPTSVDSSVNLSLSLYMHMYVYAYIYIYIYLYTTNK